MGFCRNRKRAVATVAFFENNLWLVEDRTVRLQLWDTAGQDSWAPKSFTFTKVQFTELTAVNKTGPTSPNCSQNKLRPHCESNRFQIVELGP